MSEKRTYYIAFDGCDGSGKSLLSTLVRDHFRVNRREDWAGKVVQTFMPGGTPLGLNLRTAIKDIRNEVNPLAERLLFAADNAQFMSDVILPAAGKGKLILCDRWSFFTDWCYGLARGMQPSTIETIQSVIPKARLDILFLCMAPFDVCMRRLENDHNRERTPCRIEKAGEEFLRVVWDYYTAAAQEEEPSAKQARVVWHAARSAADHVIPLDGKLEPPALRDLVVKEIEALEGQCE